MYSRILLSIDETMPTEALLVAARDMALSSGARVIIASTAAPMPNYLGELAQQELVRRNRAEAQSRAETAAAALREAGLTVETIVGDGLMADVTLKTAAANQCDVIIIGNNHQGEVASLLLGSPCLRIVSQSRVPVLVVRV